MQENIECIEIIFKGIVQGVFFRRAVKEYATELNVYGFTKNLPDGSVLVIALATKGFLEKFINKILKKPGTGRVDSYAVTKKDVNEFENLKSFEIRS
jgi:acylphosphatase